MGLIKLKVFKGIDCEYWKIIRVCDDFKNNITFITVVLYKDYLTRLDDVENLVETKVYEFAGDTGKKLSDHYTKLKTLPEFLGAKDEVE